MEDGMHTFTTDRPADLDAVLRRGPVRRWLESPAAPGVSEGLEVGLRHAQELIASTRHPSPLRAAVDRLASALAAAAGGAPEELSEALADSVGRAQLGCDRAARCEGDELRVYHELVRVIRTLLREIDYAQTAGAA
jgi:hypothetical protein